MRHATFSPTAEDNPFFKVGVLIKTSYFNTDKMKEFYVDPMVKLGLDVDDIVAFDLEYVNNKITVKQAKEKLKNILLATKQLGIGTLFVADATYFKALTGLAKPESHIGYVHPCKIRDYEHLNICYGLNYAIFVRNPNQIVKLDMAIDTLTDHMKGTLTPIGQDVLKNPVYVKDPTDYGAIQMVLDSMLRHPMLVCDIETYGLKLEEGGLGSIAFAWNKNEGAAIYTMMAPNQDAKNKVRIMLKRFFERYTGTLIFHNCTFDTKHLIYNLFMDNPRDFRGMLHGLHTVHKSIHDTKVISYLATNSTAGNELGLKVLAHPYLGNYAEDVTDITKLSISQLLEYNLKDCVGTFYVFEKYFPIMLKDKQEQIYKDIMMPSAKLITQMELHGMPIDMAEVSKVKTDLETLSTQHMQHIKASTYVAQALGMIKLDKLVSINSKLKVKQHSIEVLDDLEFNPGSPDQLQVLLYDVLKLPVIDRTPTKNPATGAKTLDKLINHTQDKEVKDLITHLIGLSKVDKILSTFIPAFMGSFKKSTWHYLHGSFNLGGTLSGRLSSSDPNLQNLPSGSKYGKAVKKCFKAPKGWLFAGADFSSLEDRINALLTKDINKLRVYTDGYDGHCLRAYSYFGEHMPDIVNTVESINSIETKYPDYRQDSKAPTFALTYLGTYHTLMKNCGFPEPVAIKIENNFHNLYKESGEWLDGKIAECCRDGYTTVAFGLRVRTPLLAKSYLNTGATANESNAEARSVGNAISGQSYGLLNNRAAVVFMEKVWASEYKYDIMPVSLIHDAIYLMIKDDINVVKWVNDNLIEEMKWQELPEIMHDEVKLGAELDIFYPSWANPIKLNNDIDTTQIKQTVKAAMAA